MDDERYVGVVRQIISKKTAAVDYAGSMARHFVNARNAGYGLNQTAYTVWFDDQKLLTSKGKTVWHPTMIKNLMEIDRQLIDKRDAEIAKFDYSHRWLTGREYTKPRVLSDQDWIDLRAEYVGGLNALIERAKVIAATIRGDATDP